MLEKEIKRLREERAAIVAKAGEILAAAKEEKRDLTAEETQEFENRHSEADKLKSSIDTLEKQWQAERSIENLLPIEGRDSTAHPEQPKPLTREIRSKLVRAWARRDAMSLSPEELSTGQKMGINWNEGSFTFNLYPAQVRSIDEIEKRAMSVGSATGGGDLVADDNTFMNRIERAMLAYGGIRQKATVVRTKTGSDLPLPTTDDTSNSGELLGENTQAATQDVAVGQLVLQAYKFSSKVVLVSNELLEDAAIDLETLLGNMLGERIGRIQSTYFTTGTGTSQPMGIVTAATLGKTAASVSAITWPELLDLKFSVDSSYRKNATWGFSDGTLAYVKKLLDTTNRPLWQPSIVPGTPDTLDGDPYVVLNDMEDIASSAKTVVYGDLSKYWIRDVNTITVMVLRERYADYGQTGFIAFARGDGDLLDAGTHPVKYLAQA